MYEILPFVELCTKQRDAAGANLRVGFATLPSLITPQPPGAASPAEGGTDELMGWHARELHTTATWRNHELFAIRRYSLFIADWPLRRTKPAPAHQDLQGTY